MPLRFTINYLLLLLFIY